MRSLALPALCSWIAGVGLTVLVRRLAVRLALVDRPDGIRKLQPAPVPLLGGVAVFLAWLCGLITSGEPLPWLLVAAATVAVIAGVLDDIYGLRARWKLLGQLGAAGILITGGIGFERFSLLGIPVDIGRLGAMFAVVWLVGMMNAVNMLDGLDGLAATLSLLACLVVGGMAWIGHNPILLMGAVALAAALAGFLPFNVPPARVYLGDSGSTLLGLLLGVYALQAALSGSTTVAIAVPVAIMIVPIFDCAAAIIRRRFHGVGVAMPDRDHIHHRLLRHGWSPWQILARLGAVAALAGIAALPSLSLGNELFALAAAALLVIGFVAGGGFGWEEYLLIRARLRRFSPRRRRRTRSLPGPVILSAEAKKRGAASYPIDRPARESA